ncbi:MAG: hypothetical protein QOH37_3250 [Nocardioidaceae bacterium]|nr:hypothetical protein [Nocardioidaceae bacterium]
MLDGRAGVVDCTGYAFFDAVGLIAIAAVEPSPAAVMAWARGLATLPPTHTQGTLVRPW